MEAHLPPPSHVTMVTKLAVQVISPGGKAAEVRLLLPGSIQDVQDSHPGNQMMSLGLRGASLLTVSRIIHETGLWACV